MRDPTAAPRVLLLADSLDIGGAERHVVDLAVALRRAGYEVTVACSTVVGWGQAQRYREILAQEAVPAHWLMDRLVKRRFSVKLAGEVRNLIRDGGFQLAHAHMYASVAAASLATLRMDVPLVVTEHSEARWRTRRARLMSRWSYRRAAVVIAVSDSICRRLIEQDGVPAQRIAVIPNGVTPAPPVCATPVLPSEMRQGPLVGVVARLQPEKGVSIFLEAAARVGVAFPTCRFLIVGDGPLREELAIQAERLGLSQRVHFLGFRGDARALIELLDVLVVSSLSEGAPLVVLEGMSAGVPVIASAVGGIPEQIRPAVEGLLVPPGDARSLAEACIRLLQHPDWGRRMGEAGRQRAASQFSHAAMVERIEDVYQMLLRQQVSSVALHGTVPELFRTKLVR